VLRPMARGELGGASFAFRAVVAPEVLREDGTVLRELREVELYDVSVVKWGQYDEAGAALRSLLRPETPVERIGATPSSIARRDSLFPAVERLRRPRWLRVVAG